MLGHCLLLQFFLQLLLHHCHSIAGAYLFRISTSGPLSYSSSPTSSLPSSGKRTHCIHTMAMASSPIMQPLAESLSKRINDSTIASHAHLNRMITTCLPLALPPHSPDSSTYLTGILHIAPIYLQFEGSWEDRKSTL